MAVSFDLIDLHILGALNNESPLTLSGITYHLKWVPKRSVRSKLVRLVETGYIHNPFGTDEFSLSAKGVAAFSAAEVQHGR